DRAAARARADAVIAILGDPERPSAELRIVDRATGKTIARQVPVPDEAARAAEILSIRALELLRAGLLEVALGSGASGSSASGSGASGSVASGSATAPVLRGTVRLSPHFQARLALAGLGTSAHVQAAGGAAEATVAQSFGLVEVALGLRPGARVQPFLSLGAGAAHLSVEGKVSWPYES